MIDLKFLDSVLSVYITGLLLPAFGLIGVSYTGCDRVATITLVNTTKRKNI